MRFILVFFLQGFIIFSFIPLAATGRGPGKESSVEIFGFPAFHQGTGPSVPVITGIMKDSGVDSTDGVTNDQTLIAFGTSDPLSVITLLDQTNTPVGTTQADLSGKWVFDHSATSLPEGNYAFSVYATDEAGNNSAHSPVFNLTIDITPPSAPVISGITPDKGISDTDGLTNHHEITIRGIADPGSIIIVYKENLVIDSSITDETGKWLLSERNFNEGIHQLSAIATDKAGNQSPFSHEFKFSIDEQKPSAPQIISVSGKSGAGQRHFYTNNTIVVLSGKAEAGSFLSATIQDTVSSQKIITDDGGNWQFNFNQEMESTATFSIMSTDSAGNTGDYSDTIKITYDITPPSSSFYTATRFHNTDTLKLSVIHSEEVLGFSPEDIKIGNGKLTGFVKAGEKVDIEIVATAQGPVEVLIDQGAFTDIAGNVNLEAYYELQYDTVSPDIQWKESNVTYSNQKIVSLYFDASEELSAIDTNDIQLINGKIIEIQNELNHYLVKVQPSKEGRLVVTLVGDSIRDLAGNTAKAVLSEIVEVDYSSPSISLKAQQSNPGNATPVLVNVSFSEIVTGFSQDDIVVKGGKISDFDGEQKNFSLEIIPMNDSVFISIPDSSVTDSSGNFNDLKEWVYIYDTIAPTLHLQSLTGIYTNAKIIPVELTFSELIDTINTDSIKIINGSLKNWSGSGKSFVINVVPESEGNIIISAYAHIAKDLAGNFVSRTSSLKLVYDTTSPVATLSATSGDSVSLSPFLINVDFSEEVTGLSAESFNVRGGQVQEVEWRDTSYYLSIAPDTIGKVFIELKKQSIKDLSGNPNMISSSVEVYFYQHRPLAVLRSPAGGSTNKSPIPVTIAFSDTITNFDEEDLLVTGGNIISFEGSLNFYTISIIPDKDTLTVYLPENVVTDQKENGNIVSNTLTIIYDTIAPEGMTITPVALYTNKRSIPLSIKFNESKMQMPYSSVQATGGSISNLRINRDTCFFILNFTRQGATFVTFEEDSITDAAGNKIRSLQGFSIVYDSISPVASFEATNIPTNKSPIPVKLNLSEYVKDFSLDDVMINGGAISSFTNSGTNCTFDVLPFEDGLITLELKQKSLQDSAGNHLKNDVLVNLNFDQSAPKPSISSPVLGATYKKVIPIEITFLENIKDFSQEDVRITNGMIGDFKGEGKKFTANVTADKEGKVEVFVPGGMLKDLAGNINISSQNFSIRYYSCRPAFITSDIDHVQVCQGQSASFKIGAAGANLSFQWQMDQGEGFEDVSDNQVFSGTKDSIFTISHAGIQLNHLMIQCIVTGNCKPSAVSSTAELIVKILPEVKMDRGNEIVCNDDASIVLKGLPTKGWFTGNIVSDSVFDPAVAGTGIHKLAYHFTDTTGCEGIAEDSIVVENCTGTVDEQLSNRVEIYPNPFINTLRIITQDTRYAMAEMVDVKGRVVLHWIIREEEVDLSEFPSGLYLLRIWDGNKLMKEQKLNKL